MKTRLFTIIILCLLLGCTGCKKEESRELERDTQEAQSMQQNIPDKPENEAAPQPEKPVPEVEKSMEPVRIKAGEKYSGSLNNSGKPASVELLLDPDAEDAGEDEDVYFLVITGEDGKENKVRSEPYVYQIEAWVADLDEDGVREIFLSQVYASDDRSLQCWHMENGALKSLYFNFDSYGQSNADYYGVLEEINKGGITIGAYVDMLGTRDATRPFVLEGYSFKPAEGSRWVFGEYYTNNDQETWNNYGLELAKEMSVTLEGEKTDLSAGTKIMLISTDYESEADFILKDGRTGTLSVQKDIDGWGWLIDGESEQDYFTSYLPYAG